MIVASVLSEGAGNRNCDSPHDEILLVYYVERSREREGDEDIVRRRSVSVDERSGYDVPDLGQAAGIASPAAPKRPCARDDCGKNVDGPTKPK